MAQYIDSIKDGTATEEQFDHIAHEWEQTGSKTPLHVVLGITPLEFALLAMSGPPDTPHSFSTSLQAIREEHGMKAQEGENS